MAITEIDVNSLGIIEKLDDEPNDVGGLSAADLKAKFDEAPKAIGTYINGTLIPGIGTEISKAGNFPDGGNAGQVLAKNTDTAYDTAWKTMKFSDLSNDAGVQYTNQSLTESQKTQARVNIGAPSAAQFEDYVVEQGTDAKFSAYTYRKWNSGIYECWATASPGATSIKTAMGSMYRSGNVQIPLPESILTVTSINIAPFDGNSYFWPAVVGIDLGRTTGYKNQYVYALLCAISYTTLEGTKVSTYVRGTWK